MRFVGQTLLIICLVTVAPLKSTLTADQPAGGKLSDEDYEAIARRIMERVVALKEEFPQLKEIPNGIVRKGEGGAGGLGSHYKVKWVLDDPTEPASKLNGRQAVYEKGGFWFHLTFYRGRYQGAAVHRPVLFGDLRLWFDYGYDKDATVITAVNKIIKEEKAAFDLTVVHQGKDPFKERGAEPSIEHVRAMIKSGNPQVIPTLRRWLGDASERAPIAKGDVKLFVGMNGVAAFRDEKSVRILTLFYLHETADRTVKQAAAEALAAIGTKDTDLLLEVLWDMQLPLKTRCQAAAALVRLDREVGRQFLLLQYDLYRWEHKTRSGGNMGFVREILEQLEDAKIVAGLTERLPKETDRRMRNNITTLRETMSLNGQPIESLARIAENSSWKEGKYRRYPAIRAIGRKGGAELIPLLESLRPWATIDTKAVALQQRYLKDYAVDAVAAIKRRHWKESDLHPTSANAVRDVEALSKALDRKDGDTREDGQRGGLLNAIGLTHFKSASVLFYPYGRANNELADGFEIEDAKRLKELRGHLEAYPARGSANKDWPDTIEHWQVFVGGDGEKSTELRIFGHTLQSPVDKKFYSDAQAGKPLVAFLKTALAATRKKQTNSNVRLLLREEKQDGATVVVRVSNKGKKPIHVLRSLPLLCLRIRLTRPGGKTFALADPYPTSDIAVPTGKDYTEVQPGKTVELHRFQLSLDKLDGTWVDEKGARQSPLPIDARGKYRITFSYVEQFGLGFTPDELCRRSKPASIDVELR